MKRHPNRVSIEEEDAIVKSYLKHKNLHRVSEEFNKLPTSISRIVRRNGIEIKRNKDGSEHPNWKGGRIKKGDGYWGVWKPKHKRADNQGYVYEHTLVYEKNTGKLPKKGECLHHIDCDKLNNSFENLHLCGHKEHLSIHRSIETLIKPLMERGFIIFDKQNSCYVINK